MTSATKVVGGLFTAALAGGLGGGLAGLGEATLVTLTSAASKEYWLFFFGVVAYGILGVGVGVAAAIGWQILRRGRADATQVMQIAAGAAVALPGFAVGRYHVARRVFEEKLVTVSASGIVTHLLLLAGAVLVAVVLTFALRRIDRRAGKAGLAAVVAGMILLAAAIGATTGRGEERGPVRQARASGKGRPNVILVIVDTMRADAIEPYGAPAGSSPALAALARDGIVFDRTYAQSSWTRPSIASILTSEYSSVHGAIGKFDMLPEKALTLAEVLRAEGYWTAGFVTNINVAPVFNFQQGFDEFRYIEPSFYFGATDSSTKLSIYKGLRLVQERFFADRMYFSHFYQDAGVLTAEARQWIEEQPPEPFFLFLHYMDPHDPYFQIPYNGHGVARVMTPSPPPQRKAELLDLYLQDARYFDEHFGDFLQGLHEAGLYDRSIIAVTADHGEEFQEHGGWWHGTTLYEEVVRVPLIVKRANEPLAGRRRVDPVRTIDIAPALVAAAGVPEPSRFMGQNILAGPIAEPILAEETLEGNDLISILEGDWKLVIANPGNPRGLETVELYDLRTDPDERTNRARTQPERVKSLLAKMQRMRARVPGDG